MKNTIYHTLIIMRTTAMIKRGRIYNYISIKH